MLGRLQVVRLLEVRWLEEEAAHLREEEHDGAEDEQEHRNGLQVVHGVVRVERYAVQRDAVFILVLLDVDAVGVVRPYLVQRQQVQHHQRQQHDGQRHHVQGEESVQGDAGEQVVTRESRSRSGLHPRPEWHRTSEMITCAPQ